MSHTRWGLIAGPLVAAALAALPAPAGATTPERTALDAREEAIAPVPASVRRARVQLRRGLGPQGLVAVDGRTGAARMVAKLDGFLTPPTERGSGEVVKEFIRGHAAVFGLDAQDLDSLDLVRRYVSGSGIEHLVWAQTYRGIPSVDSAVRANVSASGRLLNVLGPAQPDLSVPSTTPRLSAAQAAAAAARAVGAGPRGADGSESLVIYRAGTANRLAWRVLTTASSTEVYDSVVDATTGAVVRRVNRVSFATARAHDRFPGAPAGGTASLRDITGYLDTPATNVLRGPYAHAFSDVNDSVTGPPLAGYPPAAGAEVSPSSGDSWDYSRTAFNYGAGNCPPSGCSWNHTNPDSWATNRAQATTQLFWFVNTFRDHLAAAPINFTAASGGFEGADRVLAQSDDGANLVGGGLPDAAHANNANMTVLPDGTPGLMQMYLWQPEASLPFGAVNGADDATIVYHEYTHGLSNRLVTDAQGNGALWTNQAAAMGEGWSDWYAMDFLASPRSGPAFVTDTPAQGEIEVASYVDNNANLLRFEALDCAPGDPTNCAGTPGAGSGGFTYGDFGRIFGVPEVHADGEIWAQTLWQLRQALIAAHGAVGGVERARRYITDAMRLSPDNPTFLDMRNAILQANTNAAGGDRDLIWAVFASRGMGYFASTTGGNDAAPVESFALPPAPGAPTGTLEGGVYDDTATPQSNARVAIAGHDTGLGEDLSALSGPNGAYSIPGIPAGTYPVVYVQPAAPGFARTVATGVTIAPGSNPRNWTVRRNVAAAATGGAVDSFTGGDASPIGCGPPALIDGDQAVVWGSESPRNGNTGAKQIVVKLAQRTDVASIRIDPAAGCGDGVESSLGQYAVDVSTSAAASAPPSSSFTQVAAGAFTRADNWRMNALSLTGSLAGVTYVRLRAIDTQAANATDGGFMDVSELQVFGPALDPPVTPPEVTPQPPTAVTGDASAISTTAATLNGSVNPNGAAATYHFEYGTSTGYGRQTPDVVAGAGGAPVAVRAQIGGLSAGTTYHYRLVAANGAGAVFGADRTFRTTTTPPPTGRSLSILAPRTIRVPSSGRFAFRVSYTRNVRTQPRARVTVTAPRRIASAPLRVVVGKRVTARVRLTRSGRSLLRRKRSLKATLRVSVTNAAGKRVAATKRVRLLRRR